MTFIEVDLWDLSGLLLLPRSTVGETDVAGAATILSPNKAVEESYSTLVSLNVLPFLIPNSAVFVDVASPLDAAPDGWAVEGASNILSKAGSIGGSNIRLITY